jgi:hypothetical protein
MIRREMMKTVMMAMVAAVMAGAAPAVAEQATAAAQASRLSADKAADRQMWIDEQARWNAQHMAAARRLEAVVAALKQHNTGFDIHGNELRAHGTQKSEAEIVAAHPRLRSAHEEARSVHHDLMDAVDVLSRVLRRNLGQNQSFPEAPLEAEEGG